MIKWIIFFSLVLWPVAVALNAKYKAQQIQNKMLFYAKDIIFCVIFLSAIYFLNPVIYEKPDFDKIGRGFIVEDILSYILPLFLVPFFLSFTKWKENRPKNISAQREVLGLPVNLLPSSFQEGFLFTMYIIVGVIFEEFFCRQFMFYSFNQILHLKGDILLATTSIFFSLGHFYQGWKGLLTSFILGLILGKVYQMEGSIVYPIVLHLFANLQMLAVALRRIRELKKGQQS